MTPFWSFPTAVNCWAPLTGRVRGDGETTIVVNIGLATTVKAMVAVCTRDPAVPVIVTLLVPTVASEVAVNVIALVFVAGFVL